MATWSPGWQATRLSRDDARRSDLRRRSSGRNVRRIYIAPPGVHSHDLSWSADGRYLYFSHGLPPNEMDIWRIPSSGGEIERVTRQSSRVGFPGVARRSDTPLHRDRRGRNGSMVVPHGSARAYTDPTQLRCGARHLHLRQRRVPGSRGGSWRRCPTRAWSCGASRLAARSPARRAPRVCRCQRRDRADRGMRPIRQCCISRRAAAPTHCGDSRPRRQRAVAPQRSGTLSGAVAISPNGKTICAAVRLRARSTLAMPGRPGPPRVDAGRITRRPRCAVVVS